MENIATLRKDLAKASRILANEDLAEGFGHISVRIPETDRFLVTPSMSLALVRPQDIITMNLEGKKVEGERQPNLETWIHTCIYRGRPDVNSVSHFHSFYAKVLGIIGKKIRLVEIASIRFADGVPIFTKPLLIDNSELGADVAKMLGHHTAILLRAHGAIVVGTGVKEACISSIDLEDCAKIQTWANIVGKPMLLTAEEIKIVEPGIIGGSVEQRASRIERAWNYYVSRLPQQ